MRSDLDALMAERELAGVFIIAGHDYSAALDYLVGNVHITGGLAIKKRGEAPVLVVHPMEIEEARTSGLEIFTIYDLGWADLLQAANNDATRATVGLWGRCLEKFSLPTGKIGVYGVNEINHGLNLVDLLRAAYPNYQFVGESAPTIFDTAALTKDADELRRLRSVAERTCAVLEATWAFIAGHRTNRDTVINSEGKPLTIGDVKRFVRRALLDHELEDNGMIFAQGRDAGFPHSRGQDGIALKLGQAIVFDLFPRELGGGYHHDTTRTWCLGFAPPEVQALYDTVMEAFDIAIETYGLGKPTHLMQAAVLEYFEGKGHPTNRSQPNSQNGYIHSLGHGIGLKIHERPRISHLSQEDTFQPGNVITIEPGLYYPEQGMGVRVEDSFYVAEDGALTALTDFRKDLVLPLNA